MAAKKLSIKPLANRVLVKRLEEEMQKTAGGIIVPDTAKEKPQRGKVLAVGTGKLLDSGERAPFSVKKNDMVLFGKYAGQDITVDGKEYKIMRENELLARFE